MKKDLESFSLNSIEAMTVRVSIGEAQQDLKEFNATKKTVIDLLNYKKRLIELGQEDPRESYEIKSRAIQAINNLFNDIIGTNDSN